MGSVQEEVKDDEWARKGWNPPVDAKSAKSGAGKTRPGGSGSGSKSGAKSRAKSGAGRPRDEEVEEGGESGAKSGSGGSSSSGSGGSQKLRMHVKKGSKPRPRKAKRSAKPVAEVERTMLEEGEEDAPAAKATPKQAAQKEAPASGWNIGALISGFRGRARAAAAEKQGADEAKAAAAEAKKAAREAQADEEEEVVEVDVSQEDESDGNAHEAPQETMPAAKRKAAAKKPPPVRKVAAQPKWQAGAAARSGRGAAAGAQQQQARPDGRGAAQQQQEDEEEEEGESWREAEDGGDTDAAWSRAMRIADEIGSPEDEDEDDAAAAGKPAARAAAATAEEDDWTVIDPAAAEQAAAWDEEGPAQLVTAGEPDALAAPEDDESGELWTEGPHVITQASGEDFGAPLDEPDQDADKAGAHAEAFPSSGGAAQTLRLRITTADPEVPHTAPLWLPACSALPGLHGGCRQGAACMSTVLACQPTQLAPCMRGKRHSLQLPKVCMRAH